MKNSLLCFLALPLTMTLFAGNSLAAALNDAYTHRTHSALLPQPVAGSSFKIAATWFLPDWQSKLEKRQSDGDVGTGGGDPTRSCASYGYQSSCPGGQSGEQVIVTASLSCYKNCRCDSTYRYHSGNCQAPYYLAGSACSDAGGTKYKSCNLNQEEACRGFSKTCPTGWQLQSSGKCPYDSSYGTCCNLCAGYDYASIPEGYVELGRCNSCSGIRYKIKENPCDGFTTCQYGAVAGSPSCKSGNLVKYLTCKNNLPRKAKVGDIYYTDGTFSEKLTAGKTAVGIIGYLEGKRALIVSLDEAFLSWSRMGFNDFSCILTDTTSAAFADMKGFENTRCIETNRVDGIIYPAAEFCLNYRPVSNGFGSGEWYLPAVGELKNVSAGIEAVNNGLKNAGKVEITPQYYWTSTEWSDHGAWKVIVTNGSIVNYYGSDDGKDKTHTYMTRCLMEVNI